MVKHKYIALAFGLIILSGCHSTEVITERHDVVSVTPTSTISRGTFIPARYYYKKSYFPHHYYFKHNIYPYYHPYRYRHYRYYRW